MNAKIFNHFMNRCDTLGERITELMREYEKLREDLMEWQTSCKTLPKEAET